MSEETPSPEERRAELAALRALGSLDGVSLEQLAQSLGCSVEEIEHTAEEFDVLVAAMAQSLIPQVAPPASVKSEVDRLLGFTDSNGGSDSGTEQKSDEHGFAYVMNEEGEWRPLPVLKGGARVKELSHDPASPFTVLLLELDPGTRFPSHSHHGIEETFLISGDLKVQDRVLKPGDYARAQPGSRHSSLYSEQGCRALIVTAVENYPRGTVRAYGALHKALAQCKNLFSKGPDDN